MHFSVGEKIQGKIASSFKPLLGLVVRIPGFIQATQVQSLGRKLRSLLKPLLTAASLRSLLCAGSGKPRAHRPRWIPIITQGARGRWMGALMFFELLLALTHCDPSPLSLAEIGSPRVYAHPLKNKCSCLKSCQSWAIHP